MAKITVRIINKLIRTLTSVRSRLTVPDSGSQEYIQGQRVKQWFKDDGDNTLRLNYDLNESSVVFDVGGYKGEFAAAIISKYDCTVFIFEPIPEFFNIIVNKFIKNKNVKPFCVGLSDKTISEKISLTDNSSSLYISDENAISIQLKSAVEFISEHAINTVDLIKINIEGSEYALLECLIENNLIHKFRNIQVQFHDFIIEHPRERMVKIQNELSKTHELTYQYDFVWENWKLKS